MCRTPGEKAEQVPIELSGVEFVQRWTQHILPKGFVRSRHYGNFANRNRAEYRKRARKLRGNKLDDTQPPGDEPESIEWNPDRADPEEQNQTLDHSGPRCPKCGRVMQKVSIQRRPSWRITMNSKYRPSWYDS